MLKKLVFGVATCRNETNRMNTLSPYNDLTGVLVESSHENKLNIDDLCPYCTQMQ